MILIVAIVTVVALATLAAWSALSRPDPEVLLRPLARQIEGLARLAAADPQAVRDAGFVIGPAPAAGRPMDRAEADLVARLAHVDEVGGIVIAQSPRGLDNVLSVALPDGSWLQIPFHHIGPPPDGWKLLGAWSILIVIGSAAVSLFAAAKVTRPLRLIEDAVGAVGPDGTLPHIRETGPPEAAATAAALNRLSVRLKRAMESRVRLVAAAGHDLRTPMTRMRLRAEFLPEDDRGKWLEDLDELERIADSAIALVREEVDSDVAQPVRLDRILAEVVGELDELGMPVRAGPGPRAEIAAGPLALKRALRNLIVNAATHGRSATVSLALSADTAIVTIADEGPGIPDALLDRVFEPFFRADNARRKAIPGAGLGMAIAKEIVDRFGGTITVANRTPNGLVQTIHFPLAPSP